MRQISSLASFRQSERDHNDHAGCSKAQRANPMFLSLHLLVCTPTRGQGPLD